MSLPYSHHAARERAALRHARRVACIRRMAKCAADWADEAAKAYPLVEPVNTPENIGYDEGYWQLVFLDALGFCINTDLSDEMADLQHELGINAEGYPLNDEGDTGDGDRAWVPFKRIAA